MLKRLNPTLSTVKKDCEVRKSGVNKACKFFPCHRGLEDCTFCYCPFYPCLDEKRGEYVYSSKLNKNIWSCKACNWIHKRKIVENMFVLIRENQFLRPKGRSLLEIDKAGIIILSHGSKLKKANASLGKLVKEIKRNIGWNLIVPAYLQFCQPDLTKSIKNLISRKCRRIIIIPFFLFNGNHVTRDIPNIIEKERAKFPKVNFVYANNLGKDARIADIVLTMIEEAARSGNNY